MTDATQRTWTDTAKLLIASMGDDFDWDSEEAEEIDFTDDFRSVVKLVPDGFDRPLAEFGSRKMEDTASSLYRLLWLCEPKSVDFSDMYKTQLFCVMPPDESCLVQVYLYKYALALYFFAPKSDLQMTFNNHGVLSGVPGSNNGWTCTNEAANLFIQLVVTAAETEHMVYGGNSFEV
jgi:hypothetical protein